MHWRRKWQPTPVFLPGESQGWGAWWAAVYGVAQSRTRLMWLSSSIGSPSTKQICTTFVSSWNASQSFQLAQSQQLLRAPHTLHQLTKHFSSPIFSTLLRCVYQIMSWLGCYSSLVIMNSAPLNICVQAFEWPVFSVPLDIYLGLKLLSSLSVFNHLPKWLHQFIVSWDNV